MAASDVVTPVPQTFYEGDVAYKRAVSESLLRKFASASNYIIDRIFINEQFAINGFFNANSYDNGVSGIRYVEKTSKIAQYYLSIRSTGSAGTSSFNVEMINSAGASIGNLFTTAISISGSNGTNVLAGKKDILTVATNFDINKGIHSINYGTLAVTEIPAGTMLVPFIVNNGTNAINLMFNLKMQEQ